MSFKNFIYGCDEAWTLSRLTFKHGTGGLSGYYPVVAKIIDLSPQLGLEPVHHTSEAL
jgi:hypothetical protein